MIVALKGRLFDWIWNASLLVAFARNMYICEKGGLGVVCSFSEKSTFSLRKNVIPQEGEKPNSPFTTTTNFV